MRFALVLLLVVWATIAQGSVERIPIKSGLELKPSETYRVAIDATEPVEIGWTVQGAACATNCIQADEVEWRDLAGGGQVRYSVAASLGASKKYQPVSDKIAIDYKNVSNNPVTIDIYRVKRVCDLEACKFLVEGQKGRWLEFKVDEFKTIETSKDGSYSDISGITLDGRPFHVKTLWWSDDNKGFWFKGCPAFIKRWVDQHTPKEKYSPYTLSGHAIGEDADTVLTSIDNCSAHSAR